MALQHSPSIITDGLVLYLDAANQRSYPGTGLTWSDISGYFNNASIQNTIEYSSVDNGNLIFNGVDSFVNINQPTISTSPNRWTICTWMKPNNQESRFVTPNSNGIDQFLKYSNTTQRVDIQIAESSDTNERNRAGTSNTVPIGTWTYSCVSLDQLKIKIYANSILTNEYTETIPIAGWSGTWRLGQRGNGTFWYSGSLSSFTVYNRALSNQEIQQNFNTLRGRFNI